MIVVNPSRSETLPDFTKANLEGKGYVPHPYTYTPPSLNMLKSSV
jgi:hypothetical protein